MAPYFTCEFDGRQKLIRQLHGLKLAERQGDQLFAQALQGTGFIFFPGSAFILRVHFAGFPLPSAQHQYPLNFSSVGAFAFFPPKSAVPTIQLILHPNFCIIYPGAVTAGFIPARNS